MNKGRAIWLVMDSLGLGAAPDAGRYGDVGADTYGHIAEACAKAERGPLRLPHLHGLGLAHAHALAHGKALSAQPAPIGWWGYAEERSAGKDTPSGHWESMGVVVEQAFGVFPPDDPCFPDELMEALIQQGDLPGVLGNCHASGTEIIARLGEEHVATGKPIVYTSVDSVFQIAAHETHFGLERLHALCVTARELCNPWNIGRVIARPFIGETASDFRRTGNRHDYSLPPPFPTLWDVAQQAGREVIAIGKMADIFAHQGVTETRLASGHDALFDSTLAALKKAPDRAIIATNFVEFDSSFGHRRDVMGYAAALEAFDARLPEILQALRPGDLLILSADHGCDPTWSGTDHTRETVPVLAWGPGLSPRCIGRRTSFADIGQTLAQHLGLPALLSGTSFLEEALS